jgi:cystathionine gamma-lyase
MTHTFHPETIAIHGGPHDDALTGSVCTPIFQTTTFAQTELAGKPPYCYSRTGNPTRDALEKSLAAIEGASHAFAFSSGLAAANAILQTLSAGDHIVASRDLYGGCYRLFTKVFLRFGVKVSLVDATDTSAVEAAFTSQTRLLWLETPSNPLLTITDIRACARIAEARGVRTLVDNTFATPIHQRPLELGADIVLHSTTKYIGGHCDVIGGALVTNDSGIAESLTFIQNATGAIPAPQDCFLLLRGLKTLGLRVEKHAANAAELARRLESHPDVSRVYFPGLTSHPQHDLAAAQSSGFGSIISLELVGGIERVRAIVGELRLWTLAESLGGVRSLWCHPATMTHAAVEPKQRKQIGIADGLVRLSVGLENAEDLFADLDQALTATTSAVKEEVLA